MAASSAPDHVCLRHPYPFCAIIRNEPMPPNTSILAQGKELPRAFVVHHLDRSRFSPAVLRVGAKLEQLDERVLAAVERLVDSCLGPVSPDAPDPAAHPNGR